MAEFDAGRNLPERFRRQAGTSTHLYGELMRAMADDFERGGPVAAVCRGYEDAPIGAAIQLRILAAVYRFALTGQADELIAYYPVLGGSADPRSAWPVFREVIAAHVADIHEALAVVPQTNEVGRASALLYGLAHLRGWGVAHDIDILELGASAGLNLLLPHFFFAGDGWQWGLQGSPVRLVGAIRGPFSPPAVNIGRAVGCDVAPLDVSNDEDAVWLRSFVWPFDVDRDARLMAAMQVARQYPPLVEHASADDWLPTALRSAGSPVVWQSITRQYWPPSVVAGVERELVAYGNEHPLARVWMEHVPGRWVPVLGVDVWDGHGGHDSRIIATVHPHGTSVRPVDPVSQTST